MKLVDKQSFEKQKMSNIKALQKIQQLIEMVAKKKELTQQKIRVVYESDQEAPFKILPFPKTQSSEELKQFYNNLFAYNSSSSSNSFSENY